MDTLSLTPHTEEQQAPKESFFIELLKFSALALVIVIPFRFFVAQPFIVSGASMSPTFETGQYLIVDQLSYRMHAPKRGDVIVFRYPEEPSTFFIKRIIGLPGEKVHVTEGVTHIIDPATGKDVILNEPYIAPGTKITNEDVTLTLSADQYFVMGDNRNASSDSRIWGPVPKENLMGRAFIRLFPLSNVSIFPGALSTNTSTL